MKRTDWILLLLALGLAAAWFAWPAPRANDSVTFADWSDLTPDQLRMLTMRRANSTVTLRIDPNATGTERFSVTNPGWATADPAAVDRLLQRLGQLEVVRPIETATSEYRLHSPSVEVELVTTRGSRRIALGASAPSPTGAHYAALSRDGVSKVMVVTANSSAALDIEPESLLEHRVIAWIPSELRRIELRDETGPITLERETTGRWFVDAGTHRQRARRKDVERLLLAMTQLTVTQLLEPGEARRTQSTSSNQELVLRAHHEQREESSRLRIGAVCPAKKDLLTLATEGARNVAGCVDPALVRPLAVDRTTIVDNAAFWLHGDEVETLEVSGRDATWSLERDGSAFRLKTDVTSTVSLGSGNALLDSLVSLHGTVIGRCDIASLSGDRIVSLRSFLVGDDRASTDRIGVGAIADDGTRLICRDDGSQLRLSAADAPLLELDPILVRDPQLVDVPVESIREVELVSGGGRQLLRARARGPLESVTPQNARNTDPARIETLREQLSQLRAARWLVGNALPSLAKVSNVTIEFVVADPDPDAGESKAVRHRLRIARSDPEHTAGWFDDLSSPFLVERSLVSVLDGLLAPRRAETHAGGHAEL